MVKKMGRPPLYCWDAWFRVLRRRGELRLMRSVHYDRAGLGLPSQEGFAQHIRDEASWREVNINLTDLGHGFLVRWVKFANGGKGKA